MADDFQGIETVDTSMMKYTFDYPRTEEEAEEWYKPFRRELERIERDEEAQVCIEDPDGYAIDGRVQYSTSSTVVINIGDKYKLQKVDIRYAATQLSFLIPGHPDLVAIDTRKNK